MPKAIVGIILVGITLPGAAALGDSFSVIPGLETFGVAAFDQTPDKEWIVGVAAGSVFRWSEATGTEILSPANWQYTNWAGISDDGTKIVSTLTNPATGIANPAIWTESTGQWVALRAVLAGGARTVCGTPAIAT